MPNMRGIQKVHGKTCMKFKRYLHPNKLVFYFSFSMNFLKYLHIQVEGSFQGDRNSQAGPALISALGGTRRLEGGGNKGCGASAELVPLSASPVPLVLLESAVTGETWPPLLLQESSACPRGRCGHHCEGERPCLYTWCGTCWRHSTTFPRNETRATSEHLLLLTESLLASPVPQQRTSPQGTVTTLRLQADSPTAF